MGGTAMKINSVTGPIDTSELGTTLMHEHICVLSSSLANAFPDWCDKEAAAQRFADKMQYLKKYGLRTVVEATPINHGRDVMAIRRAAELSGINVLATTGLYFDEVPWMHLGVDPNYLARLYIRDITDGMEGTDCKAALVKCATDKPFGLTEANKAMIQAAGIASLETGVPVMTHASSFERYGLAQADILIGQGVPAHRIVIGHAFTANSVEYVEELLQKGVYVGCDQIAFPELNSYENLARMIAALCKKGYEDRIFLSHDSASLSDFGFCLTELARSEQNGLLGDYTQVFEVMPDLLQKAGVSVRQYEKMLNENPRRFFEQIPPEH